MKKTRTQKAALNTITAAAAEVVQVVCSLILPRLVLANYGSAYNGITTSAKQFLSTVSLLSIGITGSTKVAFYKSLAAHDEKQTSRIYRAMEIYMRKVGAVLICFALLLTFFYPIVIDTGYHWVEVAPLIIAASISAFGRYTFGLTNSAILSADQSAYVGNLFLMATNVMNVIVSVLLIKGGANIQTVKLVASLVLFCNPLLKTVYVKRKYRLDRNCEPDNSALSMRKDAMANSLANIIHDNTDLVILTIFCGVKTVSVYTVYHLVTEAINKAKNAFVTGAEALFGDMWAKGEIDKTKQSLELYEYIVSFFSSVVMPTAAVLLLPFISLYTRGINDVNYLLPDYAIVIIIAQFIYNMRAPYVALVQGVGHYYQTKKGAYAEAAINLILSVVLVQFYGIVGVAIGTLTANAFRTFQYAIYIDNHIIKRGKKVFIFKIVWATCNTTAIYFGGRMIADVMASLNWFNWIISGFAVVTCAIFVTLLSSAIFYREDLRSTIQMAKRIVSRNRKV